MRERELINEYIAQPCLCAVQIGLTEFFRSRGITPDAIVGHSVGEVAAAHAAGYLTLEEAVHLIYTRGCQLKKTSGQGTMVAILHDVEEIEERLKNSNYGNEIDVAAINGRRQIVVSGNTEAIDAFTGQLRDEGVRCIKLKVNNAFHSFQQEKIRRSFLAKVKHLNSAAGKHSARTSPKALFVSSVTNKYLDQNDVSNASYWWMNIRSPVRFMGAIEKLLQDGFNCFLEIGPHPVLSSSIKDTVRSSTSNSNVVVSGTLQRPADTNTRANDMLHLLRSISRLHVEGYPIEHMHLFQDPPYEVISLPTYPWQHELCSGTTQKAEKVFLFPVKCHPLLGKRLLVSHLSDETAPKIWRSEYSQVTQPWLRDHKLQGVVIVPAAAYVETMLAATREIYPDMNLITVKDLKFEKFIFAPDKQPIEVSLEAGMREAFFTLRSFNYIDKTWTINSLAVVDVSSEISNSIQHLQEVSKSVRLSVEAINKKYLLKVGQVEFYDELCQRGFHLGEAFRGIDCVHFSQDYREAVVYVSVPEVIFRDCQHFSFHPALFDCIFQAFGGSELLRQTAIARQRNTLSNFQFQVPHSVEKMQVMGKAPTKMIIHLHTFDVDGVTYGEAVLADAATKQVFARVHNMTFAKVNSESVGEVQLWSRKWCPIPGSSMEESKGNTHSTSNTNEVKIGICGSVVIVKDKLGICTELIKRLEAEKITVFDPWNSTDLERDFGELLQTLTELNHVIMLSALDVHQFDSIDGIDKDQFSDAQQVVGLMPVEHESMKCGYLFAGEITRSNERSEYGLGEIVMGFRTDEYLPTTISARASQVIPVPVNTTPVNAVSIVKEYLPCFLALQNALKSTAKGTVIVCFESEHDHAGIAVTKMALEKGSSVFVHSSSDKAILERQGFLRGKHFVQVSDGNLDVHVNNLSADVLVLSGKIHLDRRSLSALAGKLRPFGTIIQFRGTTSGTMKMTQIPSNVNFVPCDIHFGQLSGLEDEISALLNLFNNGGEVQVQPACISSPLSKLSQLSASLENVTVSIDVDTIPASLNFETTTFKANPDASYLVTGGSKGFGLALVEWLAHCGARRVYALSRNSPSDETSGRYKLLQDIGVQITHLSADIGSPHDVETALLTIKEDRDHQLEGIFHAATKYSDEYLHNLTREIWDDVMMSKGYGALLLHQVTMKLNFPLKYFVMVSSVAEMIGNRGQGNYSATNRFLSSLCTMRRNRGLPATALVPGVISSEGFAAREGLVEMWMKLGFASLSPSEILHALEGILSSDYTVIGVVGFLDGLQFSKAFHVMVSCHFSHPDGAFSILKSLIPPEANAQLGERDLVRQIKRESREEAKSLISTSLAAILSNTLGYSEEISQEATLVSLGLDSHLSSDLSNAIYEQFGVTLSAMSFLNDTLTFRALTEATYTRIMSAEGNGEENAMISLTQTLQDELWLDVDGSLATPSAQLICFPSVGEGPTMFAKWKRKLDDRNIQMITVQMPGWERREQEKPLQNFTDIVTKLADLILPTLIRGHFVFFGHSIGGLIAFELAHYLKENYNLSPAHLFISSWFSPTLEYPRPEDLKENGHTYRTMQRIVNSHVDSSRPPTANGNSFKFSFFEPSTFSTARRKNALIPSIQAAIVMCKKYRHVHKDKLHCSLTVLGGKDDDFISPNLLDNWKKEVHPSARFQKILLPGKHMYILFASKPVLKEIMAVMKKSENGSQNKQKRPLSRFWEQ
ncbi:mycocerosic acid synthase-like polyketide synthase [Diadema antillarum]|uniref:mycocerosic acid synthase-like polyketide synthase n=1 Tax=Diadema antillarum TaxID=105358 RepID=UPI003A853903